MSSTTKDSHWGVRAFLIFYHLLLLIGLPIYFYYSSPSMGMIIWTIILYFLTGMSITAGYHRFYAHRTYRAHSIVEVFLLFFASIAGQGSALRWAYDHRLHHAYVDTDKDPHSIKKGFWYAHILWLFQKPAEMDTKVVADLTKNKLVMFQHRHFALLMTITNVGVFLFFGWLLNDYLGSFFIAVWLRLFALHHCTWFINSLAHTWGEKPFSQEQTAVDNYVMSLLTFGEGYHNYHHTFANDYRNGIRWYHYDPTKWLIWTLNKLGFAQDLKHMDWYTVKKRMVLEHKDILMSRLSVLWLEQKEELSQKVNELSERLLEQMASLHNLKVKYSKLKKECASQDLLKNLESEYKQLKKNWRLNWRLWMRLSKSITRLEIAQ